MFRGLSEDFLRSYRLQGDAFPNLLARSTYLNKYSRNDETWTDTIARCVVGSCENDPSVSQEEAEKLFHVFWTMQGLPPGRGLWTGGIPGIPTAARYNCHYTTIRDYRDWGWVADQLMMGGGVGVGLREIHNLPSVARADAKLVIACPPSHADAAEVGADTGIVQLDPHPFAYVVEDSREGWVKALLLMFLGAFEGNSVHIDVSQVRCRGTLIRTFGGVASGPGPLVDLLRSAWAVIRGAQGRKLSSVECLDITNFIGRCIKAGNVRRSALIALGDPSDQGFRDAKKDLDALRSHRHTSNNSIVFQDFKEFDTFDWKALVQDNLDFGEPGYLNLALGRKTDPGAMGVNPCGEQLLWDFEACNLAEVFPARFDGTIAPHDVFKLIVRYCLRQRLAPMHDPRSDFTRQKNMRVGVGIGGICDFKWTANTLSGWFETVRGEANHYADELKVARPLTVTTVKPSGTISLLNGSSPGIHAPFDRFYVRRTSIVKDNPMALALMDAGVPYETSVYDSSGRTLSFMFPMKSEATGHTTRTETVEDQLQRQYDVQTFWADNAVSATISFDRDKPEEMVKGLTQFGPSLKSTSMLTRAHGYAQAPYESITEDQYKAMASTIRMDATLTKEGDLDIEECSSGACPIRLHVGHELLANVARGWS
jgi:ribonucleoside-triphosphate reductase